MADEHKTDTPTDELRSGKVVFESQADLDAIIQRRIAKEREKYSDYDKTKEELDQLRQNLKEREEAELSENDKLKKQLEEKIAEINELYGYKDKWVGHEKTLSEKIEKELDGLTDEQQDLVKQLPLLKQMDLIAQFKEASTKIKPPSGYPPGTSLQYSVEELNDLRKTDPKKFAEVYPKWKASRH